jgi:hypothetical protein
MPAFFNSHVSSSENKNIAHAGLFLRTAHAGLG